MPKTVTEAARERKRAYYRAYYHNHIERKREQKRAYWHSRGKYLPSAKRIRTLTPLGKAYKSAYNAAYYAKMRKVAR